MANVVDSFDTFVSFKSGLETPQCCRRLYVCKEWFRTGSQTEWPLMVCVIEFRCKEETPSVIGKSLNVMNRSIVEK